VAIIRLANPSLLELIDLLSEILDRRLLPEGSVILLGSVSYLNRVGTSIFAREWTIAVDRAGRRWPNARVGPLTPIIRTDVVGGVAREMLEIAAWYAKVYVGKKEGFLDTWNVLVPTIVKNSGGHVDLPEPESYTLSLPSSLQPDYVDSPSTYKTQNSRPLVLHSTDKGTIHEILTSITAVLHRDFNITVGTGATTASAPKGGGVQENIKRVVLIGASNMKKIVPLFEAHGLEVVDMTVPGWVVTPGNVAEMVQKVKGVAPCQNTVYILELFGNSCTRVALFDGSTTLPIKGVGGYHLPGEVALCSDGIFFKLFEAVQPLLDAVGDHIRLLVPPLPRYMYHPCCGEQSHCTNVKTASYPETILMGNIRLRSLLKKKLAQGPNGTYWVADTCCMVSNANLKTVPEKLVELKGTFAQDGVHLTGLGYRNLAKNLCDLILQCQDVPLGSHRFQNKSAAVPLSGTGQRYFWRGFTSPVGSRKHHQGANWVKAQKWRPHNSMGPYSNWRGRSFKKF
jgi:hypothetical protein